MLGLFAGLGILSKYLFIYLLVGMDIFFYYMIIKKKVKLKSFISLVPFFLVLLPHIFWLVDNNYITFNYAFHRTGLEQIQFLDHILNPIIFTGKQLGILIPFFIMFFFIISKIKLNFDFKDEKLLFLVAINVVPIIFIFFNLE